MVKAPSISLYSVGGWAIALGVGVTIGMVFRPLPTAPKPVTPLMTAETPRQPASPTPKPPTPLADENTPLADESAAPSPDPTFPPGHPQMLSSEMAAKLPKIEDIQPLPSPNLPEEPPHEGALIDLTYTVDCPDLVLIEVLETLPGRPIFGERLVRPDGTITLGFYGDLYVRGLTCEQIKVKVILHLRRFMSDATLGLIAINMDRTIASTALLRPNSLEGGKTSGELPKLPDEGPSPFDVAADKIPKLPIAPELPVAQARPGEPSKETATLVQPPPATAGLSFADTSYIQVPLAQSDRIFVDVAKYNSKVYYVLGAFNSGGKFPVVGNETVLDAIQHGGGMAPNADRATFRLVRPAWGKRPAQTYPINLDVIENHADKHANLQMLPGDRLLVDRHSDRLFRGNAMLPPPTFPGVEAGSRRSPERGSIRTATRLRSPR